MAPSPTTRDVSALVEQMFADVFTADERTHLLVWIRRWESENPDVGAAQRVTGWIDVAYEFQEHLKTHAVAEAAPDDVPSPLLR